MRFNPIKASDEVIDSYGDYIKSTFFIRDDELRQQFNSIMSEKEYAKGPFVDCVGSFETAESINELIETDQLDKDFKQLFIKKPYLLDRCLYTHQVQSICKSNMNKNIVITTGTGSGKTECFLYPIINYLLREKRKGTLSAGVRALLLYPMNALANDQMLRLRELLENYPDISFGSYTGETETKEKDAIAKYISIFKKTPIPNEILSRDRMLLEPPNILLTNYAMLEYLLLRPRDTVFFDGKNALHWKYIVLDEAHSYRGANGIEVSMLLRRLYHRLQDREKIRFYLTSATLGGQEKNKDILAFASNISCGLKFNKDDIIRAQRNILNKPFDCKKRLPDVYTKILAAMGNDPSDDNSLVLRLHNIVGDLSIVNVDNQSLDSYIYDFIIHDELYYKLHEVLADTTLQLDEISTLLSISIEDLTSFINLASMAIRNGLKVLDIRYHLFIRALEGAYVTFYPKKTLTIHPRKEVIYNELKYQCFKISVCQYCGEIYLEGSTKNEKFEQPERFRNKIYMIVDESFIDSCDDEDDQQDRLKRTFELCCQCRSILPYQGTRTSLRCGCKGNESLILYEVASDELDAELHRCEYCHASNSRGSVLRGFYVGQNAAASVLGSALYEVLPKKGMQQQDVVVAMGRSIKQQTKKQTKQLLVFSDSRQDAAYFASYFQFTYDNIVRRRLLLQVAQKAAVLPQYNQGIPLNVLISQLARALEINNLCEPIDTLREAWKIVLYEIRCGDRNGLSNLGLLHFEYISKFDEGYGKFPDVHEFQQLDCLLMDNFLNESAIQCPVQMTADDIRYYMYQSKRNVFSRGPKSGEKTIGRNSILYWIAINNSRKDLLRKTNRFSSDEEMTTFLGDYFQAKTNEQDTDGSFVLVDDGYQLNPDRIKVIVDGIHRISWMTCPVCGRIEPDNFMKKCTNYRCTGTLSPVDIRNFKNYQRNHYLQGEIFPMIAKEHTAQLSHITAREYQNKFIHGDIQVLSSSTTFEMGVDVGDLETVFMRNMPPSPANYVQRAGRAGRRSNSAAFALTFCKLSNHDFTFYKNPVKMIKGTVSPPVFKMNNDKIARRHVYSCLLSFFWKHYPELKTVEDIFSESVFKEYIHFMKNIPFEDMQYIKAVCANVMNDSVLQNILNEYIDDNGLLEVAKDKYADEISYLNRLIEDKKKSNEFAILSSLDRSRNTLNGQKIIDYFSRNNLIPKYGFPVDTVELATDAISANTFNRTSNRLKLQRDLIQAIAEYAPGAEIVADGLIFKSQYIRRPVTRKKNWQQYLYAECENENCKGLNLVPFYEDVVMERREHECIYCHNKMTISDVFIIPEYGFITSNKQPEKSTTKNLRKTHRTQIYYVGDGLDNETKELKHFRMHGLTISITTTNNDRMAVVNTSKFHICHTCGYSEISLKHHLKKITKEHPSPSGYPCQNKILYQKSIGYTFLTDVAAITFNEFIGKESFSILYTLLEGLSRYLEIERDDIDGTIAYRENQSGKLVTYFLLFDTVPGGAGNTNRLITLDDIKFNAFLHVCFDVVDSCTCGNDGDGNAACYSCLCNYYNQYYHDKLNRNDARQIFSRFI